MPYAVVGAVVAVVGAGVSAHQQNIASKEQKAANRKAARIEAVRGQRERAQALAQNRVNQASVLAQGANAGVSGSSGVQGTVAGLGTQQASNASFAGQIDQLNQQRLNFMASADKYNQRAATTTSIANGVSGAVNAYGQYKNGQ